MALPTSKSEKGKRIEEYEWLIYGAPKIGKSTFCSQMDDVLIIDTQQGYKHLEVFKYDVGSWPEFLEACSDIAKSKDSGELKYKVVALDMVDDLYKYCYDYIASSQCSGWHPGDEKSGKGWNLITDEFCRVISKLRRKITVSYVSHSVDKTIKTGSVEFNKILPTFYDNKAGRYVNSVVDGILYLTTDDEGKQICIARGNKYLVAGGRNADVLEPEMPLDYKYIQGLFKKKYEKEDKGKKVKENKVKGE